MTEQDYDAPEPGEDEGAAPIEQDAPEAVEPGAEPAGEGWSKPWSQEDEKEARLFKWKPADEWRGDLPQDFAHNPADFLERLKSSRIFRAMDEKLNAAEKTAQDTARRMEAMNQQALQRQAQAYEARMQQIAQQQRRSVETADTQEWDRLERERHGLQQHAPQAMPAQPQGPDPYVREYAQSEDGKWLQDPLLAVEAETLISQNQHVQYLPAPQQVEFVRAHLRMRYPEKFQTAQPVQQQRPRQRVDGGGLGGPAVGASAFNRLPTDAKSQFERFAKEGLFTDTKEGREQYAREYNAA